MNLKGEGGRKIWLGEATVGGFFLGEVEVNKILAHGGTPIFSRLDIKCCFPNQL